MPLDPAADVACAVVYHPAGLQLVRSVQYLLPIWGRVAITAAIAVVSFDAEVSTRSACGVAGTAA